MSVRISVTQREGNYVCHEDNKSQDSHYGATESQRGKGRKPEWILWWQTGIRNIRVKSWFSMYINKYGNKYRCMCMYDKDTNMHIHSHMNITYVTCAHTHTLSLSLVPFTSGLGRSDSPIPMSTLCAQTLISKDQFPHKNK